MAGGTGQTLIDFGAGANEASVAVTDLADILATSKVEHRCRAADAGRRK